MMNEVLMLAILPAALWLILIFLRVPAVTLILSILAGKLFSEELSQATYDFLNDFIPTIDINYIKLGLLFLPVVISIILTRAKVAKSKALMNSIPLLFAAVSIILFALPYTDFLQKIGEDGQDIVDSYQNYIVCATAGIALLFAWLPDIKSDHKKKKHK